jgi:hypothetical protein
LAVAHRCQQLVQAGVIANYATLARLGHLSRARVTQILGLLLLAPDIQEMLLFLPATERGRDIELGRESVDRQGENHADDAGRERQR